MAGEEKIQDSMKQWLAYAPEVPELATGKKWHVFLSYRSVHRDWAIQLYDALTQAGFNVFLDQFKLIAGASLVTSLSQAMTESASGIIIWSSESCDSAWCQTEYETMHRLQSQQGAKFRFVVIKTDDQDLPLFAQNSLYENFSHSPEGPHGAGLLQVMYGLVNKPLSEEAARFAQKIDEDTKDELIKIEGAKEIGDSERLYMLGSSNTLAWLSSPLLACQAAEALIELGEADDALDLLSSAEGLFPKSIRPKQLKALALARSGQWSDAQRILAELYAAGHRDPETLGLFARTWMDRYKNSCKLRYLEKSRNLYAEAFSLFPNDYYTGINAAAKSVFLGDLVAADVHACRVEALVGDAVVDGDYWKTATVAEVQLIRKNIPKAVQLYRAAVTIAPEAKGNHSSTLGQAQLLMNHLALSPEERLVIESAFS
jgi:hypothetical protein